MTLLGLCFAAAYVVGYARRGLPGYVVVLAAAVPFGSSSMIVAGGIGVSPFYVGVMGYLGLTLFNRRRDGATGSKPGFPLLTCLWLVVAVTTAFAPFYFEGLGVFAPGLGIDEQVGALTALAPSESNLAQVIYLTLNLLLIFTNLHRHDLAQSFATTAFAVGLSVGMLAVAFRLAGVEWPSTFFDNNPRGFYAPPGLRLRAQFSEPSQLGAFSLVAGAYFATRFVDPRHPGRQRLGYGVAAASAITLQFFVASGTALAGSIATIGIVVALLAPRVASLRLHIHPGVFLLLLLSAALVTINSGRLWAFGEEIVFRRTGGLSLQNRSAADQRALEIFRETWGLGVGLGSNRSSSMLALLLSTVGLIGTLLVAALVVRAVRRSYSSDPPIAIALIAFASASLISLADFASPTLWMLIAIGYAARGRGGARPGSSRVSGSRRRSARR